MAQGAMNTLHGPADANRVRLSSCMFRKQHVGERYRATSAQLTFLASFRELHQPILEAG